MRTVILWVGVLAASILGLLVHVVAPAYVQSGTCFTNYQISVTSCYDVSSRCSASSCSSSNGDVSYTCYYPYSCSGTARQGIITPSPTPTTGAAASPTTGVYNGYDQSGSCYSSYGIKITSCSDLNGVCPSQSCTSSNGAIQYSCTTASYYCTGKASPATPAPTPSTAQSGNCVNGRGLSLTTCADTSSFNTIGCTCYKCDEVDGHITLSCSSPFECSNVIESPGSAEAEPPKLDIGNYAVICAVYVGSALFVAAIAWCTKPRSTQDPATNTASTTVQLSMLTKAFGMIRSLVVEPNIRDDGSLTTTGEFWASNSPWVALLGCGTARNVMPHYKPRMTTLRAIFELIGDVFITLSLSFLVGTVVNNSEACSTVINGDYCQKGGTTINKKVSSTTSNGLCESLDIDKTSSAYVLSTVLTKAVSIAGSYAEGTAKNNATRMSTVKGVRILLTLALLVFGFVYSYHLVSETSGKEVANRRYKTIVAVLWPTWLIDQVTSALKLLAQRCCKKLVKIMPKDLRVAKVDQLAGSVVRPNADEINLQQRETPAEPKHETAASGKVASPYAPSAPQWNELDDMVRETEATAHEKNGRRQ